MRQHNLDWAMRALRNIEDQALHSIASQTPLDSALMHELALKCRLVIADLAREETIDNLTPGELLSVRDLEELYRRS